MLHLYHRRACYHLFQREDSTQTLIVVHHIYIINIIKVLGLTAHLFQTLGHTPIFVHDDHFGTHKTTGSILVILQEVYNVARLFNILDVRENLFLLILVHVTDNLDSVVSIHVIYETFGDNLGGKVLEKVVSQVLVHFGEGLGSLFIIKLTIKEMRLFLAQFVTQFGNIGRVHLA